MSWLSANPCGKAGVIQRCGRGNPTRRELKYWWQNLGFSLNSDLQCPCCSSLLLQAESPHLADPKGLREEFEGIVPWKCWFLGFSLWHTHLRWCFYSHTLDWPRCSKQNNSKQDSVLGNLPCPSSGKAWKLSPPGLWAHQNALISSFLCFFWLFLLI